MKERIMRAALHIAARDGFMQVTRAGVATFARIAPGSISYHFGPLKKFQTAIVLAAIAAENLAIVGQAIAAKHPAALKAPDALKAKALKAMQQAA